MINLNLFVLKVVDTNSHVLYKKQDAQKGKFAFTTDDYDMFEVCFESEGMHSIYYIMRTKTRL